MQWHSLSEFIDMGGRGGFVWGAYGTMAALMFVEPLLARTEIAGLGHISEICDGDAPHRPVGCPFQAWSVAEALRLSGP